MSDKPDYYSEQIKRIMSSEWGVEVDLINDEYKLGQVPQWDSMGHVSLLLKLQSELNFKLTPTLVQELTSMKKITEYVTNLHTSDFNGQ